MQTQSSTTESTVTTVPLTQDMMTDRFNAFITACHANDVNHGIGVWYRKYQSFKRQGMKMRDINQAMYDWAAGELQTAKTELRVVH